MRLRRVPIEEEFCQGIERLTKGSFGNERARVRYPAMCGKAKAQQPMIPAMVLFKTFSLRLLCSIPYIVLFLLYMSKTNQKSFALLYCSTPKLDTACKLGHKGETKGDIATVRVHSYRMTWL